MIARSRLQSRPFSTAIFDGNTYVAQKKGKQKRAHKFPASILKFPPSYKTVKILFGDESRAAILRGITKLAQTSQLTLGPGGRNIAMEYEGGDPKITKDGVTVLKSIDMSNRAEELAARLLKQSAGYTNKYAGDGTTSSALISKEIIQRGITAITVAGAHPVQLKRGLEKGMRVVQQYLKEIAMPVTQMHEVMNVCNVSSNYNEAISEVVAKTLTTVGLEGVINMTESPTGQTRFALVNGLILERGYITELFVQSSSKPGSKLQACELEHPLVLVVADKITKVSQIAPILDLVKTKTTNRPLLVISEDLQDDPMSTMVYNNQKDILQCCAVNIPWLAGVQKELLKDVAAMTGATVVDNEHVLKLENVELRHFGSAKMIKIDETTTHIVGGGSTESLIDARMDEIRRTIETEEKHQMKGVHRERLARMQAKIAEIQIGGSSDVERGEERDLVVDALNSARSAMQHGVLPGGGVALYQASKLLQEGLPSLTDDESERAAVQILAEALKQPLRQLIRNKTALESEPIIDQIEREGGLFTGYDVKREKVVDMVETGIVDSLAVVQTYLQDAVTLSGLLLTTEALIYKEKTYTPLPLKHYQDRREFF